MSKCVHILKDELETHQTITNTEEKILSLVKEKPTVRKTFESDLDEQQVETLARSINKARIFTNYVSHETVSQVF